MNILEILFYQPIYNLIVVFYRLLGDNLGLAVIAIAIVSRVAMIPLTSKQIKMAESSKEFQEKSKKIKKKFKNKQKQQEELLKLQQEYLPAQLSGCLPLIIQFIIFIVIYNILSGIITGGITSFNRVAYPFVPGFSEDYSVQSTFLGLIDLKASPAAINQFPNILPYLVLIVLVGVTQYFSFKIMTAARTTKKEEQKIQKKPKKKDDTEDFGEIMQRSSKQAATLMPILLTVISFNLPSGLSIYLITTSLFVILQQSILARRRKLAESQKLDQLNNSQS